MASWLSLRSAVFALDLEEAAWVEALHAEARSLLDEGLGLFAYTYRITGRSSIGIGSLTGLDTAAAFWPALASWGSENQAALARIYRTGVGSLETAASSALRAGIPLAGPRERFEPHGVRDVFTVVGHDNGRFGVFLTAPRASSSAPNEPRAYERLAVELAAAARLREHRRRAHGARLSAGETRVAALLADGASDKLIAAKLGVTLSTVSTFTRRLRAKLGCRPGAELLALRSGVATSSLQRRLALFDRLSASECDVASALLAGDSYAEIAAHRGVSVRTVAAQCAALFRKCGVSGRRELASALLGA